VDEIKPSRLQRRLLEGQRIDPTAAPRSGPGSGGWVPSRGTPLWLAGVAASLQVVAVAVGTSAPAPWGLIVGTGLSALSVGLSTLAGTKSAGPRVLE
jgi:hypothetical protein